MSQSTLSNDCVGETGIILHPASDSHRNMGEKTGSRHLADNLLATAHHHQVRLRQDPVLVETLAYHNVLETVPPELYSAVAEILTFLQKVSTTPK